MQDINALLEQLRALLGRQPAPTGGSAESEIATQMGELAGRRPGNITSKPAYKPGATPMPTMDNSPESIAAGNAWWAANKPNTGWAQDTLNAGAAQDALAQLGAKPMGPAVMPPNMTNKPMPLGDMAGVFNDLGMGAEPAPSPERPATRIPKSGGGRNLQRVSPGVYRNQKGGLVQRKTGGR